MKSPLIVGWIIAPALFLAPLGQSQQSVSPSPTPGSAQSSPPAPSKIAPVQAANVSSDYVIGPGDSLAITTFKEPSFSGNLPVRPDGMISLSLVGDIPAAGLTPMRLGQDITQRLHKFVNDPDVTVTVLAVNSKRIFLLGEIGKPGPLDLLPGLTPLQAIASSGGLTAYANARHIYILRTVGGKQQKIPFNYKKAIKDGDLQGVTLVSGDTIVVP